MSPFRLNLLYIILKIPAILIAFTVQGYAKALVADKFKSGCTYRLNRFYNDSISWIWMD